MLTVGCHYVQFLPFLKPPVSVAPRGTSETVRGPGFAAPIPGADTGARGVAAGADWSAYNNTPDGARFSPLAQIDRRNVGQLRPACTFDLGETTPMESGPVVVRGVMYLTTAEYTYALDAASCRLRWKHAYHYYPHPDYDLRVNRGVAYLDTPDGPRLYRGANDGRVYALDARTGEEIWNVREGEVSLGETFPAAPIAWHGLVYIGNAGGDNYAVTGRIVALDARTGAQVWSTPMIPTSGEAALTWPAERDRFPRAGGTTWTSYTLDTLPRALYVPTGNAAPDFLADVRAGADQHAYSVVVLDARTGAIRRAYQLLERDAHDWDVAAAPVLVEDSAARLIVQAGKDGHVYGIAPVTGEVRYATPVTTLVNGDAPMTAAGTRFCPGVQGGVEWNGPAYVASTHTLYVGAVDWCTTVRIQNPREARGKRGIPWTGSASLFNPFGVMDPVAQRKGWFTALDAMTGKVRWRLASTAPFVAGVTATAGGLVFTADLAGNFMALDAESGTVLFRYNTGQPVGGGVVSYSVAGRQYVAVASGLHAPLTWKVKSSDARVIVLSLP